MLRTQAAKLLAEKHGITASENTIAEAVQTYTTLRIERIQDLFASKQQSPLSSVSIRTIYNAIEQNTYAKTNLLAEIVKLHEQSHDLKPLIEEEARQLKNHSQSMVGTPPLKEDEATLWEGESEDIEDYIEHQQPRTLFDSIEDMVASYAIEHANRKLILAEERGESMTEEDMLAAYQKAEKLAWSSPNLLREIARAYGNQHNALDVEATGFER